MQQSILTLKLERLKLYKCRECSKIFANATKLKLHLNWHETKQYLDKPGVLEHVKSAHVKLDRSHIYRCNQCPRAFINIKLFLKHQSITHAKYESNNNIIKPFECEDCDAKFAAYSTLLAHSVLHQPMPHICHCGIGFYKQQDLTAHTKLVHPTPTTWRPQTNYSGPKTIPDFAIKPKIKKDPVPRLKAELVTTQIIKKKCSNKENFSYPKNMNIQYHDGERPYRCFQCPKTFMGTTLMQKHIMKCHNKGKKVFDCKFCNKTLASKKNKELHERTHTGERPYKCEICHKKFTQMHNLSKHLSAHANLNEYKCKYCDKRFNVKQYLVRHENIHTGKKWYTCEFCEKAFNDASALGRHRRLHTGEKPYPCSYCPRKFSDRSAHIVHVRRKHEFSKFGCKLCGKKLSSVHTLNVHLRVIHRQVHGNKMKYYECDYCGKQFFIKNYLNLHITHTHLQVRKFECGVCSKRFRCLIDCNNHIKSIHLKKRDLECGCGKKFILENSLKRHIEMVHGKPENKYECYHCSELFPSKWYLRKHIVKKHLKIQCKVCSKYFSCNSSLIEHKCEQCSFCKKYFLNNNLQDHIEQYHSIKEEIFECDVCSKLFPGLRSLKKHRFMHKKKRKGGHICDGCGKEFDSRRAITRHIFKCHMPSLYCNVCKQHFYSESSFKNHKKMCKKEKFPCNICDEKFPTLQYLNNHLKVHLDKIIKEENEVEN